MTTTSPSWLPTWATGFPDIGAVYDRTIRRQFGNLYDNIESDEYADVTTVAGVLSIVAQGSQWIRRYLFPQNDDEALFLDLWEAAFGLAKRAAAASRQNHIIRSARFSLGTATDGAVRAIFAAVFGEPGNPDVVSFESPSSADIIAAGPETEDQWARVTTSMHVYHTDETTEPNQVLAQSAIEQMKGAPERWTIGQYKTLQWGGNGEWGTACWG